MTDPQPRPSEGMRRQDGRHDQAKPQRMRVLAQGLRNAFAGLPGWAGGVLAGAQGALFSYALVVVPVWVMGAAAATPPSFGESSGLGARVWLTSMWVPWAVEGVPFTLAPLAVTGLTALMLASLMRRFASADIPGALGAVLGFAAVTVAIATTAWARAVGASDRVQRALLVALALATCTALVTLASDGALDRPLRRIPAWLRGGVQAGIGAIAAVVVLGGLVAVAAVVAHRGEVAQAASDLGVDSVAGTALAFLETMWAPTLAVWGASWALGQGFHVGAVTYVAGDDAPAAPLIPLAQALPEGASSLTSVSQVAVIAFGAALGWWLLRRLPRWADAAPSMGVAVAVAAIAGAVLARSASGAAGPGALAEVGVEPWAFGLRIALLTAAGLASAASIRLLRTRPWRSAEQMDRPSPQAPRQ